MPQVTFNGTKINVEFTESSSRQQLNSGENISTLFGKIKKIFSDLKAVCFSGSYNDLSDKPSSLPANGGNADTLNGMSAETIRSMSKNVDSGTSVSSPLADGTYCGVWSDAPSVLSDTQGILIVSNYNTNGAPSPWSHRTFYSPHYNIIWHGFTANYNWYGWKEISTTPIKSTTFSGTTGNSGNMVIWATSERKIPLFAEIVDCYCFPFLSSSSAGRYMIHAFDSTGDKALTTVSGTVYYIEI